MNAKKKRKLKVKRMFEPGRMALTNLKEAYECLVPATVRIMTTHMEPSQPQQINPTPMEETSR